MSRMPVYMPTAPVYREQIQYTHVIGRLWRVPTFPEGINVRLPVIAPNGIPPHLQSQNTEQNETKACIKYAQVSG